MEIIFGIFAHPDDETLVAGTLKKKQAEGAELNMILVTDGQAGSNPDNVADLAQTRLKEWRASGNVIGAARLTALHYGDGQLHNEAVETIVNNISNIIRERLALIAAPATVSLITFDKDGLTGHHDHIVVTQAVIEIFTQLKTQPPAHMQLKELLLYRLTADQAHRGPGTDEYPLTGYEENEIDRLIDVSQFVSIKKKAMQTHTSQINDMSKWIAMGDTLLSQEAFRVVPSTTGQES